MDEQQSLEFVNRVASATSGLAGTQLAVGVPFLADQLQEESIIAVTIELPGGETSIYLLYDSAFLVDVAARIGSSEEDSVSIAQELAFIVRQELIAIIDIEPEVPVVVESPAQELTGRSNRMPYVFPMFDAEGKPALRLLLT